MPQENLKSILSHKLVPRRSSGGIQMLLDLLLLSISSWSCSWGRWPCGGRPHGGTARSWPYSLGRGSWLGLCSNLTLETDLLPRQGVDHRLGLMGDLVDTLGTCIGVASTSFSWSWQEYTQAVETIGMSILVALGRREAWRQSGGGNVGPDGEELLVCVRCEVGVDGGLAGFSQGLGDGNLLGTSRALLTN